MLQDYDTGDSLWGTPGAAVPMLDDSCLPFARGQLTFGSGMSVKMTVTRLQQVRGSVGRSVCGWGVGGGGVKTRVEIVAEAVGHCCVLGASGGIAGR